MIEEKIKNIDEVQEKYYMDKYWFKNNHNPLTKVNTSRIQGNNFSPIIEYKDYAKAGKRIISDLNLSEQKYC